MEGVKIQRRIGYDEAISLRHTDYRGPWPALVWDKGCWSTAAFGGGYTCLYEGCRQRIGHSNVCTSSRDIV